MEMTAGISRLQTCLLGVRTTNHIRGPECDRLRTSPRAGLNDNTPDVATFGHVARHQAELCKVRKEALKLSRGEGKNGRVRVRAERVVWVAKYGPGHRQVKLQRKEYPDTKQTFLDLDW